jgi:hypothetical protein
VPIEPTIVIYARHVVFILCRHLLDLRSERGLIIRSPAGHQGSADPFFGCRPVIVVTSLIPALIGRRLIKPCCRPATFEPFADLLTIPCFWSFAHHALNLDRTLLAESLPPGHALKAQGSGRC